MDDNLLYASFMKLFIKRINYKFFGIYIFENNSSFLNKNYEEYNFNNYEDYLNSAYYLVIQLPKNEYFLSYLNFEEMATMDQIRMYILFKSKKLVEVIMKIILTIQILKQYFQK
jgi:hypothetical protein